MTALPTGTVAFLMTDIEGSTRLVRDLGAAFPALLSEHFTLLGGVVSANGGTLVSSEGDSIFAVFPSVRQAVAAAVDGQRALAARSWPDGAQVRVRMGVHAGEAVFGGRDYTGLDVHRTARIMAAGHGGEILLSEAARALASDDPGFRDLGSHQLRDMPEPEHLFQALAPGLPSDFPPLRTVPTSVPTNLPTPLTRFVGRTAELAAADALLDESRVVTLTGPGGTGKTRLSIELGRTRLHANPGGVWFVELDVVRDPALVLPTIARTLGVREVPGEPPVAGIARQVAGTSALVILDNLEQVIGAAPDIAQVLAAAPGLRILATSREPLGIAGERLFAVPPLAVPDEPTHATAAALAENDCVALFVERARAARADFALSNANAAAVAAICRRLDGLPLALELAAARVNLLSPEQILARMDHRLTLLASSRRDLADRQRTLRGAIDWSYDLLAAPERTFFRRFATFSGGADLEAVQAVIDPDFELGDGLDLASALVDRSLLRSAAAGAAYRVEMLQTLREYAAERLAEAPEETALTRRRHLAFFAELAEAASAVLTDPNRDALLDRLDHELANLRAAIGFAIESGDVEPGIRIAVGLKNFWHTRGHLADGFRLLGQLVDATASRPADAGRARLLMAAAEIATWYARYEDGRRLAEEAFAIATASKDPRALAWAHVNLAWATTRSDPAFSRSQFSEAARLSRAAGATDSLWAALGGLGTMQARLGEYQEALATLDEAIALSEHAGDRYLNIFNVIARGLVRGRVDARDGALDDYVAALREARGAGSSVGIALALEAMATWELADDPFRAAILAAGSDRVRTEVGGGASVETLGMPAPLGAVRSTLAPERFAAAVAEGRALSTDALIDLALSRAPRS